MRVLTSAVMALFLVTATAHAQTTTTTTQPDPQPAFDPLTPEPEGLTLTPFLGFGFGGDYENTPASFGAALGYGMSPRVSVEGELYFAPGGEQGELVEFDSSIWSASANVLYHFTGEDFTPYVTAGIGILSADTEAEMTGLISDDTSTEFAWNWGGGLKSAISERFGLRADLRYVNGDDLAPDHWRMYGGFVVRRIGQ
jgi:opacity protein-like surface antigen